MFEIRIHKGLFGGLLVLATVGIGLSVQAATEDAVATTTSARDTKSLPPVSMASPPGAIPGATPGKPHGGYDPHAALDSERMIKVALQHRAEGRMPEALKTLDEAIGRFPTDAELFAVRGSLSLERGRVTPALEDFEASLKLRPDDARTLVNRSQAYRRFGREGEALADLNRAVEIDPDLVPARFNRGVMFHEKEDYKKALVDFEHCVAVDPHSAAPYFNRAATYDAIGNRTAAIADLERFMELAQDDQWKKAASDILRAWQDKATAESKSVAADSATK